MNFTNNVKALTNKVLNELKADNSPVLELIEEAPSELARTYFILQSASILDYTKEERELATMTKKEIEASNEFTLEDAKFLKKHNGNNPKMVYWNNLIAELENK